MRNPRNSGEEAKGKGRGGSENGEAKLGASRKGQKLKCGESILEGPGTNQRNHRQLPSQQPRTGHGPRA